MSEDEKKARAKPRTRRRKSAAGSPPSQPQPGPEENTEDGEDDEGEGHVVVLPPEAVREAAARGAPLSIQIQAVSVAHAGPLPAPSTLREYETVHPGLTGIIVSEFQNETKHRRRLQQIGQSGALILVGAALVLGGLFGWITEDWRITLALTVPICGALGVAQLVEFWLKLK